MSDKDTYINEKQSQIIKWLAELARLDMEARELGEDRRVPFEVHLNEFNDQLKEVERLFSEMNMSQKDDVPAIILETEKKWDNLKKSFEHSVLEFGRIKENK